MKRLDVFLHDGGFAESRTEAKRLIEAGKVKILGKTVTKPSYLIEDENILPEIEKEEFRYASRGGLKLQAAIDSFNISPNEKLCIDIGASTGGFTDCLLQHGAAGVVCIDSGSGQLKDFLRRDGRVVCIENYNARELNKNDLPYTPSLAVMDVSFISATYIITAVFSVLDGGGEFILLIKPQFEVGKSGLSKGGIVKDEKKRKGAIDKVVSYAESVGFRTVGVIESPITGGDGNTEYIAYFRK